VHSERSPYQAIEVFDSASHGRVLVLDGCVMLTERDEFVYHEMLAHVGAQALGDPRQAVVVGGGDGGIVRELLEYPQLEVTQAEIDERVTRVSQEYFPAVAGRLTDPRVTLAFADGAQHLRDAQAASLDLVVVDSTDPIGPAEVLITEEFYRTVARSLKPGGALVAQTQSPFWHPESVERIYGALARVFPRVWMYWATCPSYLGFIWTFCFASAEADPLARALPADVHTTLGTSYYSAGVHRGAFALPPFLQRFLPEGHPQREV
jgi:spermidine synthase